MTRESAIQILKNKDVIQAAIESKYIQCSCDNEHWITHNGRNIDKLDFTNPNWKWRIKPEPQYRPWTPEEVPVGALLRSKVNPNNICLICGKKTDGYGVFKVFCFNEWKEDTSIPLEKNEVSYDQGKTWQPCGVAI